MPLILLLIKKKKTAGLLRPGVPPHQMSIYLQAVVSLATCWSALLGVDFLLRPGVQGGRMCYFMVICGFITGSCSRI